MSDSEITPIDRPLMRSDLDGVRRAMHALQQVAVQHYTESTAARREQRFLAAVCVSSALLSFALLVAGIR